MGESNIQPIMLKEQSQITFICSKSTVETLEEDVFIVNFDHIVDFEHGFIN